METRSRFLINDADGIVILLNFKCGFTSVCSVAAKIDQWTMEFKNPQQFGEAVKRGRFANYKFHLIARNPYDRLISYYWHWFVRRDEKFIDPILDETNRHFKILKQRVRYSDYKRIVMAGPDGRQELDIFDLYISWVPVIWPLDAHLWPQHLAYSDNGIELSDLTVWDISDLGDFFSCLSLSDNNPIENRSVSLEKSRFRTPTLRQVCDILYRRDFLDLDYFFE